MSRTLLEIEADLDATIADAITSPSASQFAEWRLWKTIFARAIWIFEGIMDLFKADIVSTIQAKQPGSFDWYFEKILEFQGETDQGGDFLGDNLIVQNGIIQYEIPDETRRIITNAALYASGGALGAKLAKALTATTNQALTASELLAFGLYIDNIKYPGTEITVISKTADKIKYTIEIIYDPIYTTTAIEANVLAKLEEYRTSLGFNDKVYKQKVFNKIMEAAGVVAIDTTLFQGWGVTAGVFADIDIVYTLESGYFNYDAACALTFTSYKTL